MTIVQPIIENIADTLRKRRYAKQWSRAGSIADLGELTAQWLEGQLHYTPTYCGRGPDPETTALVPTLAAANRAGYITTQSQPATPLDLGFDGELWQQRAGVEGFMDRGSVALPTLLTAAEAAGLIVITHDLTRPQRSDAWVTVTTRAGRSYTEFGGVQPRRHLRWLWGDDLSGNLVKRVTAAIQVTVIDPVWGRNDVLWPLLEEFTRTRSAEGARHESG